MLVVAALSRHHDPLHCGCRLRGEVASPRGSMPHVLQSRPSTSPIIHGCSCSCLKLVLHPDLGDHRRHGALCAFALDMVLPPHPHPHHMSLSARDGGLRSIKALRR